jgi:hypothetical protein
MTTIKPGLDKRVAKNNWREGSTTGRSWESLNPLTQLLLIDRARRHIRAIAKELPPRTARAVLKAAGIKTGMK